MNTVFRVSEKEMRKLSKGLKLSPILLLIGGILSFLLGIFVYSKMMILSAIAIVSAVIIAILLKPTLKQYEFLNLKYNSEGIMPNMFAKNRLSLHSWEMLKGYTIKDGKKSKDISIYNNDGKIVGYANSQNDGYVEFEILAKEKLKNLSY